MMSESLVSGRLDFDDDGGTGDSWHWARGHIVSVRSDGFAWGNLEDPRNFATAVQRRFALLRFPGVPVSRIQKYLVAQYDQVDPKIVVRGRLWQFLWSTIPQAAKDILRTTGMLTIGSPAVGGDFTWTQAQAYFVRLDTGESDTEPM